MATAKVVDTAVDPGPAPDADAPPEVLSPKGTVVVKIGEPFLAEFSTAVTFQDEPVTITPEGIQVTKAQAAEITQAAALSGVTLTHEDVA